MCAKKKPSFALWLTIWLSFKRRKIFLETVLQILLIKNYAIVTLAARLQLLQVGDVLKPCSTGVVSKFRFK